MDSVELTEEQYAKEILILLQDMDIIPDFMFDTCYDYFISIESLDYLTREEKCLMSFYLSQLNILYEDWNIEECNKKKSELYSYYLDNKDLCNSSLEDKIQSFNLNLKEQTNLRKRKTRRINKTVFYNE